MLATLFDSPRTRRSSARSRGTARATEPSLVFERRGGRYDVIATSRATKSSWSGLPRRVWRSKAICSKAWRTRGARPGAGTVRNLLRSWFGFTEARLFRECLLRARESALKTQISPDAGGI